MYCSGIWSWHWFSKLIYNPKYLEQKIYNINSRRCNIEWWLFIIFSFDMMFYSCYRYLKFKPIIKRKMKDVKALIWSSCIPKYTKNMIKENMRGRALLIICFYTFISEFKSAYIILRGIKLSSKFLNTILE